MQNEAGRSKRTLIPSLTGIVRQITSIRISNYQARDTPVVLWSTTKEPAISGSTSSHPAQHMLESFSKRK